MSEEQTHDVVEDLVDLPKLDSVHALQQVQCLRRIKTRTGLLDSKVRIVIRQRHLALFQVIRSDQQ